MGRRGRERERERERERKRERLQHQDCDALANIVYLECIQYSTLAAESSVNLDTVNCTTALLLSLLQSEISLHLLESVRV